MQFSTLKSINTKIIQSRKKEINQRFSTEFWLIN